MKAETKMEILLTITIGDEIVEPEVDASIPKQTVLVDVKTLVLYV